MPRKSLNNVQSGHFGWGPPCGFWATCWNADGTKAYNGRGATKEAAERDAKRNRREGVEE